MVARWWRDRLQHTGFSWLQDTSYSLIDHSLICAFVERWHGETSSLHLPFGEMSWHLMICHVCCISPLRACFCPTSSSHGTTRWTLWWRTWGLIQAWFWFVRIYFLYLVGITLFTDKSQTAVDVVYLRYFRDLDVVADYSWGVATLAHLYREFNNVSHWKCGQVSGYLTLLQV